MLKYKETTIMLNRIFKTIILFCTLTVFVFGFSSCEKQNETIGVIIVKNSNGNTISGATVTLHNDGMISSQGSFSDSNLKKVATTDSNGRAEFVYNLEAIFQVDVEKISGNDIYTGSNVIRLLKEKTVVKVVEIN